MRYGIYSVFDACIYRVFKRDSIETPWYSIIRINPGGLIWNRREYRTLHAARMARDEFQKRSSLPVFAGERVK